MTVTPRLYRHHVVDQAVSGWLTFFDFDEARALCLRVPKGRHWEPASAPEQYPDLTVWRNSDGDAIAVEAKLDPTGQPFADQDIDPGLRLSSLMHSPTLNPRLSPGTRHGTIVAGVWSHLRT